MVLLRAGYHKLIKGAGINKTQPYHHEEMLISNGMQRIAHGL